ncbi:hypothetical protein VCRA2110O135_10367 [Vibrio crassostreae]|nr:hypothetical protein VCRA2110O135_10367 [Vibrio crassostreae]
MSLASKFALEARLSFYKSQMTCTFLNAHNHLPQHSCMRPHPH